MRAVGGMNASVVRLADEIGAMGVANAFRRGRPRVRQCNFKHDENHRRPDRARRRIAAVVADSAS
jgi:hypothetical protein